ncbi:MAG: Gfo/Idh/MocA family oxidoreductase [Spirochaetaceae bacterium]
MTKKSVNWAIIGCGDVTEVKSGPGLYKADNSNLIGVFNRTLAKAEDYVKRHGLKQVYNSVDELLADSLIDVVYIATPPNSHFEYTIKVLEAGKIPYIEKPMVTNIKDALVIESLAKKKNITPYVAFYRRGLEKFIKIKEILDSGIIGDVKVVNVIQLMNVEEVEKHEYSRPWRVIPEISGGGKFLDVGTHVLDCLIWYFGELETMTGIAENRGGYYIANDTVLTNFRFKNGVIGTGTWCFVADRHFSEIQIIGEKGNITYDGLSVKNFSVTVNNETTEYNFETPEHISMPYQLSISSEILGQEKSNASFSDSLNLVKMCNMLL